MIELERVQKAYRTRKGWRCVLDDVSVRLPTGENIGIVGRNGSGKSTLLRLIGGSETPDSGTIRSNVRISWPLGFGGAIHGLLTGRENARFMARIYGLEPDYVERFAEDFAEIDEYFDMPVITYSTGMRARLAFGLSMSAEFDCYLVDEVTAVGDKVFQDKCKQAFAERRGRASVIMVSHDPQVIKTYCERAAVLRDGKLSLYDSVDEATAAYNQ